jgi:NAD-dependent deacetylase
VHVHGELFASRREACGLRVDHAIPDEAAEVPELRVVPPRCGRCEGHVRPGVVWFNEALPDASWSAAMQAVEGCDLLLVIGTSGLVHPAAGLPGLAKARGAYVVEVNPIETALSGVADATIRLSATGFAALLEA